MSHSNSEESPAFGVGVVKVHTSTTRHLLRKLRNWNGKSWQRFRCFPGHALQQNESLPRMPSQGRSLAGTYLECYLYFSQAACRLESGNTFG